MGPVLQMVEPLEESHDENKLLVKKGRRKYVRNDFMGGHYNQAAELVK